jgi:hypothetical protein
MTKIAGSGSISQRHGSADPDPDLDPPQNVMDLQHCPVAYPSGPAAYAACSTIYLPILQPIFFTL